jgi:hypothetical protein
MSRRVVRSSVRRRRSRAVTSDSHPVISSVAHRTASSSTARIVGSSASATAGSLRRTAPMASPRLSGPLIRTHTTARVATSEARTPAHGPNSKVTATTSTTISGASGLVVPPVKVSATANAATSTTSAISAAIRWTSSRRGARNSTLACTPAWTAPTVASKGHPSAATSPRPNVTNIAVSASNAQMRPSVRARRRSYRTPLSEVVLDIVTTRFGAERHREAATVEPAYGDEVEAEERDQPERDAVVPGGDGL